MDIVTPQLTRLGNVMRHSDYVKFFSKGYCPSGQAPGLNRRLESVIGDGCEVAPCGESIAAGGTTYGGRLRESSRILYPGSSLAQEIEVGVTAGPVRRRWLENWRYQAQTSSASLAGIRGGWQSCESSATSETSNTSDSCSCLHPTSFSLHREKKMGAAENKQLLQQIFEELSKGNSEPFVASMADDFRWTVTGTTKWSRTYEGKQSVLAELFGPLRARIDGRIRTTADRLIAEGDYVVVEARGSNTTKSGVPYNNNYCFVFRLSENQLREVTEYFDTELVTAALGRAEV